MPVANPGTINVPAPFPDKRALTIEEYCSHYGSGRTTAYEDIKAGRLKAKKRGRRTVILKESADALLASLPDLDTREVA